jgi:hypothetical protein
MADGTNPKEAGRGGMLQLSIGNKQAEEAGIKGHDEAQFRGRQIPYPKYYHTLRDFDPKISTCDRCLQLFP